MSTMISVIIPIYNAEKYIKKCLDSIVSQTLGIENIEVILIDDFSTDNSIGIVKEYLKKYSSFKLIELEANQGQGNARNIGLKHVSSDYITFLDSDDFILENTFENSLEKMKKSNSELLIYNSEFFSDNLENIPLDIHQLNIKEDMVITDLNEYPQLIFSTAVWNKIFDKKLFKFLNFPNKHYEDTVVAINTVLNSNKIYLNSESKYFYRRSGDDSSTTTTISLKSCRDLYETITEIFSLETKYSNLIKAINLKFTNDILFWIFHYDWYIEEEMEILNKLREFINKFSKKDIDFFKSIYSDSIIHEEAILNLNNYDNETFLAKFKYFNNLPYFNSIANLYIDTGNGFNEEEKIAIKYELRETNEISFNLSNFKNITNLRFDPLEQAFIKCKLCNVSSNNNKIDIMESNSLNNVHEEYQTFTTLDPYYILENISNRGLTSVDFKFKLKILNKEDLNNLFNEKDNIINNLTHEVNLLKEVEKNNSKNSFFGLIKR